MKEDLEHRWRDLGEFIREQRRIGHLSLRKLSEMAGISNPYLSQIERGLRKPVGGDPPADRPGPGDLLRDALRPGRHPRGARAAPISSAEIRRDPSLTEEQKKTLIRIYDVLPPRERADGASPAEEELARSGALKAAPVPVMRRLAVLSLHTSPLVQPGRATAAA